MITSNLANLLSALTGYFGKPISARTLPSGMSLKDGVIEESQLAELAERAGLKCRIQECSLADLSFLDPPILIILNNGDASILVKRDGMLTDSGGRLRGNIAALERHYSGRCYTLTQ